MTIEVTISGVRYVPVMCAAANLEDVARALVATWWGDNPPTGAKLQELVRDLRVCVTDDPGIGEPMETFMAQLAATLK